MASFGQEDVCDCYDVCVRVLIGFQDRITFSDKVKNIAWNCNGKSKSGRAMR